MCIISKTYRIGKVRIKYLSYRLQTVSSQPNSQPVIGPNLLWPANTNYNTMVYNYLNAILQKNVPLTLYYMQLSRHPCLNEYVWSYQLFYAIIRAVTGTRKIRKYRIQIGFAGPNPPCQIFGSW